MTEPPEEPPKPRPQSAAARAPETFSGGFVVPPRTCANCGRKFPSVMHLLMHDAAGCKKRRARPATPPTPSTPPTPPEPEPAPAPAPPPPPPKRARTAPQQEFKKGQRVDAKFGYRWYRGTVDDVIRDGAGKITAYEVEWPSNGDSNRIARGNVRAPVAGTELG